MPHCAVPVCNNDHRYEERYISTNGRKLSFHCFPKASVARKRWLHLIRRDEGKNFKVTNSTVVCSAHFKATDFKYSPKGMNNLKSSSEPSIFSWVSANSTKKPRKQPLDRTPIGKKRPHSDRLSLEPSADPPSPCAVDNNSLSLSVNLLPCHDYAATPFSTEEKLEAAQERIAHLEQHVEELKVERFGVQRFLGDDETFRFYTGFVSYKLFLTFYEAIEPFAATMITYSQHRRKTKTSRTLKKIKRKLLLIDELFLFLNKMKLGTLDQLLADMFDVTQSTVSRIVTTWVNFLYCVLGSQRLWPSREQVRQHRPKVFREMFPNTRVILDATELKVQMPSSLVLNSMCYSSYKGTTTLKCLVGIAPSGAITFLSSLYAGSISDKAITRISGVLDLLEPGDEVMADKGFLIQEYLEPRGCSLVIPHFLSSKGQFTEEENQENNKITNARVHVERAIRRCKEFHFFDHILPLTLAGSVNQLWAVCCLLTNFQGPLIREVEVGVSNDPQ